MDNRLSIYVSSPDSYADVFAVFYNGFRKYWADCPYEFNLTTNTQKYEGINCLCNNKPGDTWVERTIAALPQIKTKYLLLICDDLLLNDVVCNADLDSVLSYMDKHDIKYCRLKPINESRKSEEVQIISPVNKRTPYAINLQIGIFRKDYLEQLLGDGRASAWDIENRLNIEASESADEDFEDIISVNKPILKYVHGVYKGKWFHKAIKYINKELPGYKVSRPVLEVSTEIKIILIDFFEKVLPPNARILLKQTLSKLGVKFATSK